MMVQITLFGSLEYPLVQFSIADVVLHQNESVLQSAGTIPPKILNKTHLQSFGGFFFFIYNEKEEINTR